MSAPKITTIAKFPPGFFLENITATAANGLLVTVVNRAQLYHIPIPDPASSQTESVPLQLEQFPSGALPFGIIRSPTNPNVFYLLTTDFFSMGPKKSHVNVLDFSNPATGGRPQQIVTFPPETTGLNGFCALSESVLIAADSFGSCIWRIDLDLSSFPPKAGKVSRWIEHESMAGKLVLPDFQPGTNGLKYSARTGCAYYTSTQQKLFCRIRVNPETLNVVGEPQIITRGMQGDDMILDDEYSTGPVAYLTTHRDNTILRVPLDVDEEIKLQDLEVIAKGSMNDQTVLGPTAGAWGVGQEGKVAYFTTDGGLKHPLGDGVVRQATVVRIEF